MRRSRTTDDGVAAVEFALVLPLLVVLLFVIVNGGMVFIDQLHLQSAARDAARIASVEPQQACSTALAELAGNDVGTTSCELVQDCTQGTAEVRLVASQVVSLPVIGDRTVNLDASSTFVCAP
jgi:Flp pilus assembly protein TadG